MQQTNLVTQLASTEVALVRGIDQATARLEQVGTVHLDAALARLDHAARETVARLEAGAERYRQILADVARAFAMDDDARREDVAASSIPLLGLPAPEEVIEDVVEETPVQTAACSPVEPARDDRVIPEEQPARPRRKRGGR